MERILEALRQKNFNCLAPGLQDDLAAPDPPEPGRPLYRSFETPTPDTDQIHVNEIPPTKPLLFKYFLDGSMNTTTAGHIVDSKGRCLPILLAQVAVAATRLENSFLEVEHYNNNNVLYFPDTFSDFDKNQLKELATSVSGKSEIAFDITVDYYEYDRREDPMASARSNVLKTMHDMEIKLIDRLAQTRKLTRESLLLIDGSLQFYQNLSKYREAFQNVVGVAKSFDLHNQVGKGKRAKQVGTLVAGLEHRHRTVAREVKVRNVSIGSWYLRLHPARRVASIGDGVVKLEVFPEHTPSSKVSLSSSRCQRLSRDVLALRHPATPKTDPRWASHLYPVYMTERYLKLRFRTPSVVRGLL